MASYVSDVCEKEDTIRLTPGLVIQIVIIGRFISYMIMFGIIGYITWKIMTFSRKIIAPTRQSVRSQTQTPMEPQMTSEND